MHREKRNNPSVISGAIVLRLFFNFLFITSFLSLLLAINTEAVANSSDLDPKINALYESISQSKSIGVFTKLSIQNNATRLNKSFEEHHNGKRPPNIKELRERYDLMVQEMMVLVQGKDPELAREIYETRLLLWSYLSDPEKYKSI
jgi:hypothetical protein